MKHYGAALCAAMLAAIPATAGADQAQSARVIAIAYAESNLHFNLAPIVEPVVIAGSYALADWVAGTREGEVLLLQKNGKWTVIAFENSSLADARFLVVRYHLPQATATALVKSIRAAEQREGSTPH